MNSAELRRKLGYSAREKAKDVDLKNKTKELEKIYSDVLNISKN
jgi:hypothetical protein